MYKVFVPFVITVCLLADIPGWAGSEAAYTTEGEKRPIEAIINAAIDTLTIQEKVAQLVVADVSSLEEARKILKNFPLGGIIAHSQQPALHAKKIRLLQERSNIPLLVGGHLNQRLLHPGDTLVRYPIPSKLTYANNSEVLKKLGYELGRQFRLMGIQAVFNTQISGNEGFIPVNVASRAVAEGLLLSSVACAIPEEESNDSNSGIIRWGSNSGKLGMQAVASANEGNSGVPYQPVKYTVLNKPNLQQAPQLVMEGTDIIISPNNFHQIISSLVQAVKSKRLSEEAIDERLSRVLSLKYLSSKGVNNSSQRLSSTMNNRAHWIKQELYESMGYVARDTAGVLPLTTRQLPRVASIIISSEPVGNYAAFSGMMANYVSTDAFHVHPAITDEDELLTLLNELQDYKHVVIALPNSGRRLPERVLTFLNYLDKVTQVVAVAFGEPGMLKTIPELSPVLCMHDNSIDAQRVAPQLIFGAVPLYNATNDKLVDATGVLRYSYAEAVGMESDVLNKIDSVALDAIEEEATPGCQVLVARKGVVVHNKSYGYHTYDKVKPVEQTDLYDIASITKVLATMQAVMFLEERGMIDLMAPLKKYFPELEDTDKGNIIIRDLLLHRAGLAPFIPFWLKTMNYYGLNEEFYRSTPEGNFRNQVSDELFVPTTIEDSLWVWIVNSKVKRRRNYRRGYPTHNYRYSDLGFYIMFRLAEKMVNQPMEDFLAQNFYGPLGMYTTGYQPLDRFEKKKIVPTERDKDYRDTLVHGFVHDEGAALLGGIAGHAGIFSNANDLAKMLQMLVNNGYFEGTRYFQPGTLEQFTKQAFRDNRRGMGWDKPDFEKDEVKESGVSTSTFGHTGFTGTAVWADPDKELIYIFLSNRVHPSKKNYKLINKRVRSKIHTIVYEAIKDISSNREL